MGIIDFFRHRCHPEIKQTFNDLYINYYKGLEEFCKNTSGDRIPIDLPRKVSYQQMRIIYENRDWIRCKHETIVQEEKKRSDYREFEFLSKKYPHAFFEICKECFGEEVSDVRMPGKKKSYKQYRDEEEKKKKYPGITSLAERFPSDFDKTIETIIERRLRWERSLSPEVKSILFPEHITPKNDTITLRKKFSYDEIQIILARKSEFPAREQQIVAILKEEDIRIDYDDKILLNKKREAYVKNFLMANGRTATDKEYAVMHLAELDNFIEQDIEEKYLKLKNEYPSGIKLFEEHESKDKYTIVESEEKIREFQTNSSLSYRFSRWEELQNEFTNKSRSFTLPDYGCYYYDIDFPCITEIGSIRQGKYRVWQHFYSCFFDGNREILLEPLNYLARNAENVSKYSSCSLSYSNDVYDKVFELIMRLRNDYRSIIVLWGDSGITDNAMLNEYHFFYLRKRLDEEGIPHMEISQYEAEEKGNVLVIVELITTNERLKQACKKIIDNAAEKVKTESKLFYSCKRITYISLQKGYDEAEVTELVRKEQQKIEKKEREEREKQERIERERQERQRREDQIKSLPSCVAAWNTKGSLKHEYYYDYYAYRDYKGQATSAMWEAWKTVWNFKNDPSKDVSSSDHRSALLKVEELVKGTLRSTFGSKTEHLTLVCLTASTQRKTESRYREFSEDVCSALNMTNAFPYIHVVADGSAKHDGGSGTRSVFYDRSFFNGKYVVLFDDVRTSGRSLEQERMRLEGFGAKVICAITIAQTVY